MENYCKYRSIKYLNNSDIDNRLKHLYKGMCYLIGNSGGGIQSIVPGTNISVDATDPQNPIVSSSGGAPGLQAVTDVGNNTNDNILIASSDSANRSYSIQPVGFTLPVAALVGSSIGGGFIHLSDGDDTNTLTLGPTNLTGNHSQSFQNATGTIALETAASGTFTTVDLKTVTVVNGIITSIV